MMHYTQPTIKPTPRSILRHERTTDGSHSHAPLPPWSIGVLPSIDQNPWGFSTGRSNDCGMPACVLNPNPNLPAMSRPGPFDRLDTQPIDRSIQTQTLGSGQSKDHERHARVDWAPWEPCHRTRRSSGV